jgi:uncharacterized tellurite resistance protein B-like protein
MPRLQDVVSTKLADRVISDDEVSQIREIIDEDGKLDLDDVKLLVELYTQAEERCQAFDDLFFSVLEEVIVEDGEVSPSEQYYLLKMLYSDREILPRERDFLQRLRKLISRPSPEFEALCDTALAAPAKNWDVGGR